MHTLRVLFAYLLVVSFASLPALADGRREINQAAVEAAGGFPYVISEPGSYLLTGNLVVPANTSAIEVTALEGVSFDLGGFRIASVHTCAPSACPGGGADAILFAPGSTGHTVHHGAIRGFAGACLKLPTRSRAEGLHLEECGGVGLSASAGSVVIGNVVHRTGQAGMSLSGDALFAHNNVSDAHLGGSGGGRAVSGGFPSAGSLCDGRVCRRPDKRRFYLTTTGAQGDEALDACDAGFHMAALTELLDLASLRYDRSRGQGGSNFDLEFGPPTPLRGWVRTGSAHNSQANDVGRSNCHGWTHDTGFGTTAEVVDSWTTASPLPGWGPWAGFTHPCVNPTAVWCIED